jgi:RNA polymerase sigma-70 factor (ECF subfamily)
MSNEPTVPTDLIREFMRNRDILFGFILGLTRDHDAAEEVIQELAKTILVEGQKGTRPGDFSAWARTLARHRVTDYYRQRSASERKRKAFEALADLVDLAFQENEDGNEESQEGLKHLPHCLRRLGSRARQIIDARYRDHRGLPEIASALGWKADSVKVALAKARKALADCVRGKLAAERAGLA